MVSSLTLRPAGQSDRHLIADFLESTPFTHRHLDWRAPIDWLGDQPFWLAESDGRPAAALACPLDPPGVAWLRLFAALHRSAIESAWPLLWERCRNAFHDNPETIFAAISLHDWFTELLKSAGFRSEINIVVLEWRDYAAPRAPIYPEISIRPMEFKDLAEVTNVDNAAFALIWQNSLQSMELSFHQAGYASVAEVEGEIIGYQLSTATPFAAHLARLAVLPHLQNRSVGRLLLKDQLNYFWNRDIFKISVNTQSDNAQSLALYRKMGFELTGDSFPVFRYP